MKQRLHYAVAKARCLLGFTGMVMSAAILLGEGQARILSLPPPIHSIKSQNTLATEIISQTSLSKNLQGFPVQIQTPHPEMAVRNRNFEEKLVKKKLGLAIWFLGVLAEKS